MGKKPKQWSRRNSMWVGGDSGRGGKGDKGNQAEDSNGWEDDERRRTDVVGRRIFKANSITFCCCTAFVGLAPLSSSSTSACSFPSALPFPLPSSGFYNFLLVRCFFSLLSFSDFVFRFHFTRNSQMNFAWKQKSHAKRAKCQRNTDRGGEEKTKGDGGTLPEKVYFIFDIFSQENWNEIYLLRFPLLNQRRLDPLSLFLSCLLARSSHWYLHSSFSIHSASLENVSTSYICI